MVFHQVHRLGPKMWGYLQKVTRGNLDILLQGFGITKIKNLYWKVPKCWKVPCMQFSKTSLMRSGQCVVNCGDYCEGEQVGERRITRVECWGGGGGGGGAACGTSTACQSPPHAWWFHAEEHDCRRGGWHCPCPSAHGCPQRKSQWLLARALGHAAWEWVSRDHCLCGAPCATACKFFCSIVASPCAPAPIPIPPLPQHPRPPNFQTAVTTSHSSRQTGNVPSARLALDHAPPAPLSRHPHPSPPTHPRPHPNPHPRCSEHDPIGNLKWILQAIRFCSSSPYPCFPPIVQGRCPLWRKYPSRPRAFHI